jgi:hypothetical protein
LRINQPERSFHRDLHPGSPALSLPLLFTGRCRPMRFRSHYRSPLVRSQSLRMGRCFGGPGSLGIPCGTSTSPVRVAFSGHPLRNTPYGVCHPGASLAACCPVGGSLAFSQPPLQETNLLAIRHRDNRLAATSQRMAVCVRVGLPCGKPNPSAPVALAHAPCRACRPVGHSPTFGELPLQAARFSAAVTLAHPFRDVGQSATVSPSAQDPLRRTYPLAACHCTNIPCGTSTLVTGALRIRSPCGNQDHQRSTIVVHPLQGVNRRGRRCVQWGPLRKPSVGNRTRWGIPCGTLTRR